MAYRRRRRAGLDPGDVVADGRDLPALEALGRHQHREVGLAAGAGEGGGDVVLLALRRWSRPGSACARPASPGRGPWCWRCAARSTSCPAARCRRSPSRSSRSRASRGSGRCTWSCCRARPRPSGRLQRRAHGVHAGHELAVGAQHVERAAAHARHRAHAHGHVGAVGQLDADVGDVRAQRPHRERHHVHRAAAHRALEQRVRAGLQQRAHLGRRHPVVGRAGVFLLLGCRCRCGPRRAPRRSGRCAPGSCSGASGLSFISVPAATSCSHRRWYSASLPSHQ
jgi:hypothetical protein